MSARKHAILARDMAKLAKSATDPGMMMAHLNAAKAFADKAETFAGESATFTDRTWAMGAWLWIAIVEASILGAKDMETRKTIEQADICLSCNDRRSPQSTTFLFEANQASQGL